MSLQSGATRGGTRHGSLPPENIRSLVKSVIDKRKSEVTQNGENLNLDDTVKGLVGDECLVTDVQLEKSCGVGPVQNCLIRARPETSNPSNLLIRKMTKIFGLCIRNYLEQGSVRSRK